MPTQTHAAPMRVVHSAFEAIAGVAQAAPRDEEPSLPRSVALYWWWCFGSGRAGRVAKHRGACGRRPIGCELLHRPDACQRADDERDHKLHDEALVPLNRVIFEVRHAVSAADDDMPAPGTAPCPL